MGENPSFHRTDDGDPKVKFNGRNVTDRNHCFTEEALQSSDVREDRVAENELGAAVRFGWREQRIVCDI